MPSNAEVLGPLNKKQEIFVREFLIDLNATRAAERAGYGGARSKGSQLLANISVRSAVNDALRERAQRLGMRAEEILYELYLIGKSDIRDYGIDDHGNVTLRPGAPDEAMRAVSSIKRRIRHGKEGEIEYETEIKLWNKNDALDKAGKHLRLYGEEQTVNVNVTQINYAEVYRQAVEERKKKYGELGTGGNSELPGTPLAAIPVLPETTGNNGIGCPEHRNGSSGGK